MLQRFGFFRKWRNSYPTEGTIRKVVFRSYYLTLHCKANTTKDAYVSRCTLRHILFCPEVLKFLHDSVNFIFTYVKLRWAFESARIRFTHWIAFTEWPGGHRCALSTTWPWNVKTSLMVLWGVCWMFYGSVELNSTFDTSPDDWLNQRIAINEDYDPYDESFLDGYVSQYGKPNCTFSVSWLI